ncbi:hypothetical protein KW805_00965 [Candidatus Pacearchaeota archaeon]|nr:hypothetical protein [Candidatus Pacearchaeota archaeon]
MTYNVVVHANGTLQFNYKKLWGTTAYGRFPIQSLDLQGIHRLFPHQVEIATVPNQPPAPNLYLFCHDPFIVATIKRHDKHWIGIESFHRKESEMLLEQVAVSSGFEINQQGNRQHFERGIKSAISRYDNLELVEEFMNEEFEKVFAAMSYRTVLSATTSLSEERLREKVKDRYGNALDNITLY